MKTKLIPLLSFLSFTIYFSGCTSSKQDTVFYDTSLLNNCSLYPGTVRITTNQIEDPEIEEEIKKAIGIKNYSISKTDEKQKKAYFNISVIERSFVENFETKYSSFVYSSITDENETLIFENCSYRKSSESIVSSSYLNKCLSDIYSELSKAVSQEN